MAAHSTLQLFFLWLACCSLVYSQGANSTVQDIAGLFLHKIYVVLTIDNARYTPTNSATIPIPSPVENSFPDGFYPYQTRSLVLSTRAPLLTPTIDEAPEPMEHFADADIFDGEFPIEDHGMDEWLGDYSLLPPDIFDPELPIEVPGPEDWLVHYPAPDIFGPDIDVDVPEIEDWLVNFPSLDIFDLYFAADVLGIGDPIAQYPSAQPGINDLDIAVDVPGVEDWLRDDDFFSNHFNPDQVPIIEPTPPFGEPDRRDSEDWLSDDIPSCTLSDSDSSLFADLRLPIQTYEYAIEIDDADFLPSEDDIEEEILSRRNASEMGIRRLHPFLPQQSESTKTSQNRDIDQRSAPALSRKSPLNEKAHRPRLRQGLPDVSEPWILHQRRNGRLAPPSEREHQSKPREDESANRRNEGLPRLGTAVTAAAAIGLFTEAEKRRKRRKTERSDSAPEKTPNSEDNHSTLLENDDSVLQPETQPISQEQLVREVRGIINELVALESNCIEVHNKQAASARAGTGAQPKLNNEQWQALVASHQTLLHEHHYFVLASQNPTASPALCRLASRYAMPTRAHGKLSRDKLATEVEGQDPPGDYAVQEKEPLHQATLELAIDSPKAPESSPIRTESTLSTVTECPSSAPFGPSAMLNRLISSALDVTSDDVGLDSIEELPEKTPTPSSTDNRTPNESSVLAEEPSPPAPSSPSPPRTGAGTYTCSRCPQSFSRVCDLNKHRIYHEKPFACSICSRPFSRRQDLTRHEKGPHRDTYGSERHYCTDTECRKRNKFFPRRDNLIKHMKRKHNGSKDEERSMKRTITKDIPDFHLMEGSPSEEVDVE